MTVLLCVFAFIVGRVDALFFRNTGEKETINRALFCLLIVAFVHGLIWLIFLKKKPDLRISKFFSHSSWLPLYLLGLSFVSLILSEKVNGQFLISTIILYSTATNVSGLSLGFNLDWKILPAPVKLLLGAGVCIVFFEHARSFGENQFSTIPQSVGGGEPQEALLVFEPAHADLPLLLGMKQVPKRSIPTTSLSSNTFYGPVYILMHSEKEIAFLLTNNVSVLSNIVPATVIRSDALQAIRFVHP